MLSEMIETMSGQTSVTLNQALDIIVLIHLVKIYIIYILSSSSRQSTAFPIHWSVKYITFSAGE